MKAKIKVFFVAVCFLTITTVYSILAGGDFVNWCAITFLALPCLPALIVAFFVLVVARRKNVSKIRGICLFGMIVAVMLLPIILNLTSIGAEAMGLGYMTQHLFECRFTVGLYALVALFFAAIARFIHFYIRDIFEDEPPKEIGGKEMVEDVDFAR
jgi:hypothetical protein